MYAPTETFEISIVEIFVEQSLFNTRVPSEFIKDIFEFSAFRRFKKLQAGLGKKSTKLFVSDDSNPVAILGVAFTSVEPLLSPLLFVWDTT